MLIERLSVVSNISEERLIGLSRTASKRYKKYTIPKKNGGKRLIEHPSRELKAIQRWVVGSLISKFPVHYAATAYRKGVGIRENARRHKDGKYTNRYDFNNFFHSFSKERVIQYISIKSLEVGVSLSPRDLEFVGEIVCRNGRLTMGAPSSPAITNAMMFEFDDKMSAVCERRELIFTRYADDVFVSSGRHDAMNDLQDVIISIKREIPYLKLRLNHEKTAWLSKRYRRSVTGVVITPQHELSVGRRRKKELRSLIHEFSVGGLETNRLSYLLGLYYFCLDIEPSLEERLRLKYGFDVIERLRLSGLGA